MNKLIVSSSPHVRSKDTTNRIMLDVVIALLPTAIMGILIFGLRALLTVAVCCASAVLAEFVFNLIVKKQQTISDFSALVTGLKELDIPTDEISKYFFCDKSSEN